MTFGSTLDAVPLVFYRVKDRGTLPEGGRIVQIELSELDDE